MNRHDYNKLIRRALGLSINELGRRANLSTMTISKYERGQNVYESSEESIENTLNAYAFVHPDIQVKRVYNLLKNERDRDQEWG